MSDVEEVSRGPVVKVLLLVIFIATIAVVGCLSVVLIPAYNQIENADRAEEATELTERIFEEIRSTYRQTCQFPPNLPALADPSSCCGGEKCVHDSAARAAWSEAGITAPSEPTYFVYEGERIGDSRYVVRGVADFRCDSSANHTFEIIIDGRPGEVGCMGVSHRALSNEFQ